MRIKLSYTVDEEDVLGETAKLLGLAAHEMQTSVDLFGGVQTQLRAEGAGEIAEDDDKEVLQMIQEFRDSLLNIDMRLSEVQDIVLGYRDHVANKDASAEEDPHDAVAELMKDNFGAD
tara:strand:- start:959 stop:1312 length:354 start_codon:yes stop_codon:yes gene_type:complete